MLPRVVSKKQDHTQVVVQLKRKACLQTEDKNKNIISRRQCMGVISLLFISELSVLQIAGNPLKTPKNELFVRMMRENKNAINEIVLISHSGSLV